MPEIYVKFMAVTFIEGGRGKKGPIDLSSLSAPLIVKGVTDVLLLLKPVTRSS